MENRYTDSVKNAWKFAAEEASKLGSEYVGTEHLLIGISNEKDSVGGKILNSLGLTVTALEEFLQVYNDSVFFRNTDLYIAPRTKRVLEMAVEEANELGNNYVGTEHLLLAIIHEGGGLAIRILEQFNVTGGKLKRAFEQFMSEENDSEKNENLGDLGEFAVDLNERAKQGKIDPVVGRQTEINRVIQILSRRNKNNPVLIGEPGVGKTAIAEGLAQRIINNDVPEILKNCRIISLNMSSVVAGTKYRGEFEERLKKVLEEVKKHENWILFIDELHTLVGAGAGEGSMDAANIMKPALARGEIRCIGATTLKEYKKYIEKDAALERRFQPVLVPEPTVEQTIEILRGLRDKYEAHHKVKISDEAIVAAAELSDRYISNRFLPDKAIDLIDQAASRVRIGADTYSQEIKEKEADIAKLKREQEYAATHKQYEEAKSLEQKIQDKTSEKDKLTQDWRKKKGVTSREVLAEHVAQSVANITGIPVSELTQEEKEKLLKMEGVLHQRVVGQDEAVTAVANAIRRSRSGLSDPNKPYGSFLFLGPTGVGKTELCKTLAGFLFDSEDHLIRIDMSEYMEKHSVSRLIGAPPGYVGYEEGGYLTEQVRRKPYSVVLLDEVEKAHPDVFNILLQVLDDGRLTDGQGRTVDFKNTVIVMTSNIGSMHIQTLGETASYQDIKDAVMEDVKIHFRPELINRIDEVVVFHSLGQAQIRSIANIQLKGLRKRLEGLDLHLQIDDAALDVLAEVGFDPVYGARPLKRAIQAQIENPLAQKLLAGVYAPESTIMITAKDGQLAFE